jgi:general secretion pathway protein G
MTLHKKATRHALRSAFTLMEILIVVAIIVALAGVGAFYVIPQLGKSNEKIAKVKAEQIAKALQAYYADHDSTYPNDLMTLTTKDESGGPYLSRDDLLDPWGKQYQFNAAGPNNGGGKPDVWTTAQDGGRQIGNWGRK